MTPSPIRLRPATVDDVPVLEGISDSPETAGGFDWFGFATPGNLHKVIADGTALGDYGATNGMLVAVTIDEDRIVGLLSWHPVIYGPNRYPALNFGIGIVPELRGQGYGTKAHGSLADYLFAHTNVNRVEAQTDVDNIGEQRAAEKAGFLREGVLRGAQFRDGEWRDMVGYGMTRSEHKELRIKAGSSSIRTGFTA
jgi:RimJ/RimL family protein N-acetyltransferase